MTCVRNPARAILGGMSRRLRKLVALFLCAWLFALGSGVSAAFGAEIQHGLQCVELADEAPAKGDAACGHGCAGHLSAHLAAIGAEAPAASTPGARATRHPHAGMPDIGESSSRLSRPPKDLLAVAHP